MEGQQNEKVASLRRLRGHIVAQLIERMQHLRIIDCYIFASAISNDNTIGTIKCVAIVGNALEMWKYLIENIALIGQQNCGSGFDSVKSLCASTLSLL